MTSKAVAAPLYASVRSEASRLSGTLRKRVFGSRNSHHHVDPIQSGVAQTYAANAVSAGLEAEQVGAGELGVNGVGSGEEADFGSVMTTAMNTIRVLREWPGWLGCSLLLCTQKDKQQSLV